MESNLGLRHLALKVKNFDECFEVCNIFVSKVTEMHSKISIRYCELKFFSIFLFIQYLFLSLHEKP